MTVAEARNSTLGRKGDVHAHDEIEQDGIFCSVPRRWTVRVKKLLAWRETKTDLIYLIDCHTLTDPPGIQPWSHDTRTH